MFLWARLREGSGRGTTKAQHVQETPTPGHISPRILVYEKKQPVPGVFTAQGYNHCLVGRVQPHDRSRRPHRGSSLIRNAHGRSRRLHRGTSLIRNAHPHGLTIGP